MSDVTVTLPDALAREALENGLLKPELIASLLRAEIRRRRINRLSAAADRVSAVDQPLSDDDVKAEIEAARYH